MGYIMNLRKYVGHEPIIGLGATTLVFNDKNELLLNLRTDTNTWSIPGGSMELQRYCCKRIKRRSRDFS